jgi:hypothetical protein
MNSLKQLLKDLFKRAEKHSNILDQHLREEHHSIIKHGIKVFNAYHDEGDIIMRILR